MIFAIIVVFWLIFDQATKFCFNSSAESAHSHTAIPHIIDFSLVHNTGAAWGAFSDSTFLLGIVSLIVCVLVVLYLFAFAPQTSTLGTIGLSLVFAGGISNAIDRFAHGYVIDFIKTTFIDFPVFNIADIGVTCGIVLFLLSLIIEWRTKPKREDVD